MSTASAKPHHSSWQCVGTVGRPHGLRGAFFLGNRSELLPASFETQSLSVGAQPDVGNVRKIIRLQNLRGRDLLEISGVDSRTQVETLQGQTLWCPVSVENPLALWMGISVKDPMIQGKIIGQIERFIPLSGGAPTVACIRGEEDVLYEVPWVPALLAASETDPREVIFLGSDLKDYRF